jgi:DNA mismatch endonuclease Vsr
MERVLRKKLKSGQFLNVTPERSRLMGRVRSKGNFSTEQSFRLALVRARIRGWVLHPKNIFGTPDFYFPEERVAVFIDGCFWHGCKRCGHIPRTRSAFWRTKFERNRARSRLVRVRLGRAGIRAVRFWEHQVKDGADNAVRILQRSLRLR